MNDYIHLDLEIYKYNLSIFPDSNRSFINSLPVSILLTNSSNSNLQIALLTCILVSLYARYNLVKKFKSFLYLNISIKFFMNLLKYLICPIRPIRNK